jgi:DNA ligase-4
MKSLAIGNARCHVKTECILEGELVVYSELVSCRHSQKNVTILWLTSCLQEKKILPFHHIRKHVTRRGWFMNTEQDSP